MLNVFVIALIGGAIAQFFSVLAGIPSIVFLLLIGVILGPEVTNIIDPSVFGHGFETIIKLCVAIILFEAGLSLERKEIEKHKKIIIPLITIGALVTLVGGAFFAKLLGGFSWQSAFIFGSIVIVTGPTVINPLLRRIRVKDDLKNILEVEGVFIDPIGAIIAIFVFELTIQESQALTESLFLVFSRFAEGFVVGAVGGYLISVFIKKWFITMEDLQDFFILASALGIYALSESILNESGLMAAVASGAVVGNFGIPGEENLKKFKGKLSLLVISLLFVLLASSLKFDPILSLGYGGFFAVIALLFVVRPVQIFLMTFNSKLSLNEKVFLSFISPRGIVAASVASIIAIELKSRGLSGGDVVQGLVFLTIGISVVSQGVFAGIVAKWLGVTAEAKTAVIVGANAFGRLLAKIIKKENLSVCLIDTNENLVQMALQDGLQAIEGNSMEVSNLENAGINNADTFIALTTSNKVNVLASRLAKVDFNVKRVMPLINDFDDNFNLESIERLGLELALGKRLNLFKIYESILQGEYVVFKFKAEKNLNGKNVSEVIADKHLIILIIKKAGSKLPQIYGRDVTINEGDEITILDLNPNNNKIELKKSIKKQVIDI